MLKLLIFFLLCFSLKGADLYKISTYTVAGTSALDIASSWNQPESNPILGYGPFRYRQLSIKASLTGASLYTQSKITYNKRKPRLVATIGNFIVSGLLVGVAVNNWR